MAERWVRLEVGVELPRVPDVELVSLSDDREGLRVILADAVGRQFHVRFGRTYAYRNMDEGNRLRSLAAMNPTGDDVLCEVEDSEWLQWFHEETYDCRRSLGLRHFAILTPDDWVDVIAGATPTVELTNAS